MAKQHRAKKPAVCRICRKRQPWHYKNCPPGVCKRCYHKVRRENLVEDPGCKPERQREEGLWVDRFTWRRKPKGTAAYR